MKSCRLSYKGSWSFSVKKEFVLNPGVSIGAKLLYIALRSFCSPDEDTAFPSAKSLAESLNVNSETIYKYAAELEEKKFLLRHQEKASGGKFSHTVYTLFDEAPQAVPPCTAKPVTVKTVTNKLVPFISECITKNGIGGSPKTRPKNAVIQLPPSLKTTAIQEAWDSWLAYRKEKRKPVSERAAKMNFVDFVSWGEKRIVSAISNSIRNDWQGIYESNSSKKSPDVDYAIMPDAKVPEGSYPADDRPLFEQMRNPLP